VGYSKRLQAGKNAYPRRRRPRMKRGGAYTFGGGKGSRTGGGSSLSRIAFRVRNPRQQRVAVVLGDVAKLPPLVLSLSGPRRRHRKTGGIPSVTP
jgi:hypothetical protein